MAPTTSTDPSMNTAAEDGGRAKSWPRFVLAAAAATGSLALTAVFVAEAAAERGVTVANAQALVMGKAAETLNPASESAARSALWLDPLNQNALNLVYVRAYRGDDDPARLSRYRTLLARLGWRSTPAQQNLLAAAAMRRDFAEVMDRVDGLMRRNKFAAQVDPFIATVESNPQTRAALVDKLALRPPWRELLLIRGGELHGSERLVARAATMNALLDKRAKLSRIEVAPFLMAAVAGGELTAAYQLWARTLRKPTEGGLLYDGDFKVAAEQGVRPNLPVPFEWKFENGDGLSTQIGSDGGLFIRWSGRGVPILLSQRLKVPVGGRGYRLLIDADRASVTAIADKLAITLSCQEQTVEFRPVSRGSGRLVFAADPLTCATPLLTLSGRLQNVAQETSANITKLRLESR